MTIDPYHATCAYAELYVIRDGAPALSMDDRSTPSSGAEQGSNAYQFTLPTKTERILSAYSMSVLREIGASDTLAKALDMEAAYIRDLVLCNIGSKAAVLSITAIGPDSAFADRLLDGVLEMIETAQPGIREQYGDHETVLVRHAPVEEPSADLLKGQQTALYDVANYRTRISTAQTELGKLEEPAVPAGIEVSEVPDDADGVTTAEAVSVSAGGINPKQLVKFGGIGLFGGLFASLFFLALYYILTNRVLSAEEFNSRYRIRAITMLPGTKQAGAKRKMALYGRDSAYLRMSEDEQYEVVRWQRPTSPSTRRM
ncbi:MAG: hypothetical protein IJQ26_02280 [Lachnospiraceae bacterium]|nr:hypothetical protein [Lachnospiraceae bacterium]